MTNEFAQGLTRGGVGAFSFLALVDTFQINDMLYQLILTLCIILIQSVIIPLIKMGITKLKNKITHSKLHEHTKDSLNEIVDNTSDLIIDELNEMKDKLGGE